MKLTGIELIKHKLDGLEMALNREKRELESGTPEWERVREAQGHVRKAVFLLMEEKENEA